MPEQEIKIEFAPELLALAATWPLYESTCTNTGSPEEPRRTQACMRCQGCDVVVWPPDADGSLGHLVSMHGWRMDGTRWPEDVPA